MTISSKMLGQTSSNGSNASDFMMHNVHESTAFDNQPSFSFFEPDFNLIAYTVKNMQLGFNGFLEEDLPGKDIKITDFFMYNFGVNFAINRFRISLFFENFFNLTQTDFSIEPAYLANNNNLVYLEHDTPSLIQLSLVYSF